MANFHGSDIEKVAAKYQVLPENIINFGVNANPLGISLNAKSFLEKNIDLIANYPDPDYTDLTSAIRQYLHVDYSMILPANGTSELIYQLIQYYKPKKALLYTPTYSEYSREVIKQGGEILTLPLTARENFNFPFQLYEEYLHGADLVLLCNPNNPTATLLSCKELTPLVSAAHKKQIPFVIDETYIEFTSDPERYSGVSLLSEFDNLIILRGFSKFFSVPGLRLGYGLFGDIAMVKKLQSNYPWSINALAAAAGQVFLEDESYLKASKLFLKEEKQRVLSQLKKLSGLTIYPSDVNFFLLQMHQKNATELFITLLRQGLMIRNFHDEIGPGFFRFCLLDSESNDRLLKGIADFLAS